MLELSLLESIHELGPGPFAHFEGPADYPFLRYEFLSAFEDTDCLGAQSGWVPRHLVVRRGSELIAFAPAYLKANSFGEFVFDHSIADYAESRLGLRYYPKWIIAVPFTPATGPRVLWTKGTSEADREETFDLLTGALPEMCARLGLSSVHVLFPDEAQVESFRSRDWSERLGLQFQFANAGYRDFDAFLGSFRAKRRHAIRRERRSVIESGTRVDVWTGEDLKKLDPRLAFELYLTTVDKYVWGRRYLTQGFFEKILTTMPDALHFVLASAPSGAPLAGAFNLLGSKALYGRYWGTFGDVPYLHFEVCLYRGVEETIRRKLERFEPGAGGEHKESRGFLPTITRSVHHFADARLDALVRDFYRREAEAIVARSQGEADDE